MYDLKFDSITDSALSHKIADLLSASKIPNEFVKNSRGLDHGVSHVIEVADFRCTYLSRRCSGILAVFPS